MVSTRLETWSARQTEWISGVLQAARGRVPIGLRQRVWELRALRSVPGVSVGDVDRLFARIAPRVDRERLRRLHAAHQDAPTDIEQACDHERKLRVAIVKAMQSGLHTRAGQRVLDLGHGGGYFVAVCRMLGHDCHGTEVPVAQLPPLAAEVYAEITAALGFHDERRLRVVAYRPLELDGTYDLICAHKLCFNDHRRPTEWGVPEWQFFVEDARRYLRPGGRLLLELNEHVERYGRLRWYDRALRGYFASAGDVLGSRVTIGAT